MLEDYLTILSDQDPVLRKKCEDVCLPLSLEDEKTIKEMLRYVKDSTNPELAEKYGLIPACGLAANQVGLSKKFFVVVLENERENEDDPITYDEVALINPKIISNSEQLAFVKTGEGCLSVKDKHEGYVYRSARITIKGIDFFTQKEITIRAKGFKAIAIQHEYDHLFGKLYYDHIDKKDPFKEISDAIEI